MATRSYIGILKENGKVEAVYCHYDGYYKGVGDMLVKYYNTPRKIQNLINLGYISSLEKTLKETQENNVNEGKKEVFNSIDDYIQYCKKGQSCAEYFYLFDPRFLQFLGLKRFSYQREFLPLELAKSYESLENNNLGSLEKLLKVTPKQKAQGFEIKKVYSGYNYCKYYLSDKNNNRWNLQKYSIQEAIEISKTLIGCKDCKNCENCINCVNCLDCKNCQSCENCNTCEHCKNCKDSSFCENKEAV